MFLNLVNFQEQNQPEYIKVYCRFRPPNEEELSHSTNNSVILLNPRQLIIAQEKNLEIKKDYTFDGLFEIDTPKENFYKRTTKPIIEKVLKGYNGSIICYGETGTGKTYTINEIIPQVITQIFDFINETDPDNELFKIDISIIEIYKEQVNDLLDKENKNLNLITNNKNQLIIDNLTHIGVSSEPQLTEVINKGISKRKNNSQKMKDHNSKSHFIIMLTLFHYYKNKNTLKISKLFLVDLEGSERISKSKTLVPGEEPLEEQKLINKSLIALSIIVQNLSNKNDNINYAPYRDSKLTRIISDSFGGNCYTTLILTCSKHEYSTIETRNTLMFGERVKKIKNNPVLNIEINNKNNILSEIFQNEKDSIRYTVHKSYKKNNINKNNNLYNNINNKNMDINLNNDDNIDKIINDSKNDIYNDSQLNFKNLYNTEVKFLKVQIAQLKEKIQELDTENLQLREGNALLENEKKNLMEEFKNVLEQKRKEEKEDKINSEYVINNINDLHQLLNEKELIEKNLKNEIYSLKLLLEKKNMEFSEIMNEKNREIKKIKDSDDNQTTQTIQELTECLEQAGIQIDNKNKKIEQLLNIVSSFQKKNEDSIKEINELKLYISELEKEKVETEKKINENKDKVINKEIENTINKDNIINKENIFNKDNIINKDNLSNKDNLNNIDINIKRVEIIEKNEKNVRNEKNERYGGINDINDNLDINELREKNKKLNEKIIELINIIKNKDINLNSLNEEKVLYLKKKADLENRINVMTQLINKFKNELDNKNLSLNNNESKIILIEKELTSITKINKDLNLNIQKLTNENNLLRNKAKSLEDNYINISNKNDELNNKIITLEKENAEKIKKLTEDNLSKINELQNEINENNKKSLELHNLKIRNKNMNQRILTLEQDNKKIPEYENININLKREITIINKNIEEYKNNIDRLNNENNNNQIIIDNLKKDIITKNNIINEVNRNYQELEKENNNLNLLKQNIEKSNQIIEDLKNKYESLLKENNNNQNIIDDLNNEINLKNNLLEENKMRYKNTLAENESNKNLIINLKKEISSINIIVKDYQSQLDDLASKEKDARDKIENLQNELRSKEFIINDNKIKLEKLTKENIQNKMIINDLENKNKSLIFNLEILQKDLDKYKNDILEIKQRNEDLINEIESMKEKHLKEIKKYDEIIIQKDIKIKNLNQEYINSKQSLEKILELQRKVTELKIENNQMLLKMQDYEKSQVENDLLNAKNDSSMSISFQEKSTKIKNAYQDLIEENEQLKVNILKLREAHD